MAKASGGMKRGETGVGGIEGGCGGRVKGGKGPVVGVEIRNKTVEEAISAAYVPACPTCSLSYSSSDVSRFALGAPLVPSHSTDCLDSMGGEGYILPGTGI